MLKKGGEKAPFNYTILNISTIRVTSYQVSGGTVTRKPDMAVLKQDAASSTDVIASGFTVTYTDKTANIRCLIHPCIAYFTAQSFETAH